MSQPIKNRLIFFEERSKIEVYSLTQWLVTHKFSKVGSFIHGLLKVANVDHVTLRFSASYIGTKFCDITRAVLLYETAKKVQGKKLV